MTLNEHLEYRDRQIAGLIVEVKRLRDALEFYEYHCSRINRGDYSPSALIEDEGQRARGALKMTIPGSQEDMAERAASLQREILEHDRDKNHPFASLVNP